MNPKEEILPEMAFLCKLCIFRGLFVRPESATGEWLSLYGKRKDEIERGDSGNKQEAESGSDGEEKNKRTERRK